LDARHDTLSNGFAWSKDEVQAGDALNLTTARDSDGTGHVRLFDRWANPEKPRCGSRRDAARGSFTM